MVCVAWEMNLLCPMKPGALTIPSGLRERLAVLFPRAEIVAVEPLRPDTGTGEAEKGHGYGQPLRVQLREAGGSVRSVVFHLEGSDDHGHDRRADRAGNVLLAWDTFSRLPHHTRALDVGGLTRDGRLLPLQHVGELYLLTEWADGEVYAEDLRRIGHTGLVEPLDLARVDALVEVLLELHRGAGSHPAAYGRAVRDLVGSGEGIAGIVDSYGAGAPGASAARLAAIEHQCLTWRQRLKQRSGRLHRTHGDFHPFNLVFAPGERVPTLLDTSRGSQGDPADDVTCLAINFLFFGLEHRVLWSGGLGVLWRRFWNGYLAGGDEGVLEVAAPYFAWRALVLCNPAWYPHLREVDRARLLTFAERVLSAERFDPAWGEEAMSQKAEPTPFVPSGVEGLQVPSSQSPARAVTLEPSLVQEPPRLRSGRTVAQPSSDEQGVVVWFTGLPSSGKSTLAAKVAAALTGKASVVTLDGDEVRAALHPAPGYDDEARAAFYESLAHLAALTARQGHVVLVPATAHRRLFRERARALAPSFLEVFVDTPTDECRRRDAKGLYARGEARLPGSGVAYEPPMSAEVVATPADQRVKAIVAGALRLAHAP